MKITCKEYNERFKQENHGYVVRYLFGKYAVCDGLAPECDTLVEENSIFAGRVVKEFDTYEEVGNLRKILNS